MHIWFITMSLFYYIGLLQDCLLLANMKFLIMPGWRIFKIFRAFLMLADIILEFFIAFTKSQSEKMSNNDNFMD